MKFVLFVLLLSVITAFSLADCGDKYLHFYQPFTTSLDCIANARFIKKRHYRSDFSVDYSIYLSMSGTKYENYATLQSLNYTGEPVPAANHTDPEPLDYSWATGLEESLSTSLGAVEEINFNRKINYYVLYAAIDLMNYHYTKLDTIGKVVCGCYSVLNCSGSSLSSNSFTIFLKISMIMFKKLWTISFTLVFVKKSVMPTVIVLKE